MYIVFKDKHRLILEEIFKVTYFNHRKFKATCKIGSVRGGYNFRFLYTVLLVGLSNVTLSATAPLYPKVRRNAKVESCLSG